MYVCMYIRTYVWMHDPEVKRNTFTNTHFCRSYALHINNSAAQDAYTYTQSHIRAHMHAYIHTYTDTNTHFFAETKHYISTIRLKMRVHTHNHTYMHACMHTYTHTHTNTHFCRN